MLDKGIREVWIGGLSKTELLQKLSENQIKLNDFAMKIINDEKFTTSSIRERIHIVEIAVQDLGFPNGAIAEEIYQKANALGLKLCPPELALHMRLQYVDPNQPIDPPKGSWQTIAMKELSTEPNFPKGFYLRRQDDGFWLRGYRASSDYIWSPEDRFIFIHK